MPANIIAGTITFLKIGVDIRDGAKINRGEVLSLVGNVAGVIATMAILGGAAPWIIASLGIITIGAGLYSIWETATYRKITIRARQFFKYKTSNSFLDYVCAPDMRIVHRNTLRNAYGNQMLSCRWISETGELQAFPIAVPNESIGVGVGVGVGERQEDVDGSSGSSGSGLGSGFFPPTGPAFPAPLPEIIPVITIGPLDFGDGRRGSDDNGDGYGCCSGGSDGYV
jgi:hypothetical protein